MTRQAWTYRDNLAVLTYNDAHSWQPPSNTNHPDNLAFAARLGREAGAAGPR